MLNCQNKCMVSLIVSYSIMWLLGQDFELRENDMYNKLLGKKPPIINLSITVEKCKIKGKAYFTSQAQAATVSMPYPTFPFHNKTYLWLTRAHVQTEGIHPELPLSDRRIHRFMSSPCVRCNLLRGLDEVYLRLFSPNSFSSLFWPAHFQRMDSPLLQINLLRAPHSGH